MSNSSSNIETLINIFTIDKGEVKVLLFRRKSDPYKGYWALPSTFLSDEKTLEETVQGLVYDKTGIENMYTEQCHVFSDINRYPDTRVIGISFLGLIDSVSVELKKDEHPEVEKEWFSVNSVPKMAYDNEFVIEKAKEALRKRIVNSNVLKGLFPSDFTLPELQRVYEQILNKELDRRNFRKKFINLGLIEDTGYKNEGYNGRPAKLYRFKDEIRERDLF